jgi:hypothetical protein
MSRARAEAIGKPILGLLTVGALFTLISIGSVLAPALVPFHWLAAGTAGSRWTRALWLFAGTACALVAGSWVGWAIGGWSVAGEITVPLLVGGAISAAMIATTEPYPRGNSQVAGRAPSVRTEPQA